MSAGLDTSTVAPGSTLPDESRTTPAIDAWAHVVDGRSTSTHAAVAIAVASLRIGSLLCCRTCLCPPETDRRVRCPPAAVKHSHGSEKTRPTKSHAIRGD